MGAGDILRSTREAHGHTVADVAQALKLTQRQVEALETERFDLLPGAAFARGFLRNYARLLGLDPEPLIQSLSQTEGVGSPELAPVCNAEGTMPAGDGGLRPLALPVALLALLLLGAVIAGWYFDWFAQPRELTDTPAAIETPVAPAAVTPVPPAVDEAPVVIPDDAPTEPATADAAGGVEGAAPTPTPSGAPVPENAPTPSGTDAAGAADNPPPTSTESVTTETPAPEATASAAPEPAAEVSPRLVFHFKADSWVEVRDASDKIIFSRTNRAGSVQEVQGEPPFKLVIGNAREVTLEYKGKPVDLAPHTKVSVARLTLE
ncbi:helix-turn-helix domain-containing protein [Nitrogeniibacter mangrovi]|uniref:Helix-turn-helix domain-containing protein n=2 Tax=Nitrogeniibacter mangrovi TaxID=2016596 RepID=A0A6C1BA17_9RHOO|nr:helix-turn-helix domain-containing protein [Nitrogeniibacter mangrovi]